ncbi:MAG: peptide chain release factor N(5)-glutamine methyltransferase [Lachnospiraceae bacterium]|nr:peptide chain release factor N(5)-glutamine methyltransferase [Lachnospiraceae bacterium]
MIGNRAYREVYGEGRARLEAAEIAEAPLDARLLLEFVCGTDRNTLLVHGDREVTGEECERYRNLSGRRAAHVPLQHLTGEQEFMGLPFYVNSDVLVPRQDTEILVEEVMKQLHDGMRILDLCTGSGCILLSLLHYSNGCEGVGTDLSPQALTMAVKNYERLREERAGMEARFLEGDLFAALENGRASDDGTAPGNRFDIIVSNPPYIETSVVDTLMPEVREHEPLMALDGGADGLVFYRRITERAGAYLNGGGMLFFEIGCGQAEAVRGLMEQAGFCEVAVVKDFAGLDRVVYGSWF